MDVTVQSGLHEPDTNDGPGANVHEPIFGYGISATNSADRFTYVAVPNVPKFAHVSTSDGNIIVSGNGGTGTYHVLVSTNLLLPWTNWTVLASGSFDHSGNFAFTNPISSTNSGLFYLLRVP